MVWYYADGDRQRGPISDEEFQDMIDRGRIQADTLVWKDGMENWQSLDSVSETGQIKLRPVSPVPANLSESPDASVPIPPISISTQGTASPAGSNCLQCGRYLPDGDEVRLGKITFCKQCDADMARHYAQQSASAPPWAFPAGGSSNAPGINTPAGTLSYASIFSRAGAKILDNLIESVVLVIVMAMTTDLSVLVNAMQNFQTEPDRLLAAMRPFVIGSLIFGVLYNSVLISIFGATLGKMAMGIRVVHADGSPVSASQAIIRAVVPAIIQIPAAMVPESAIASVANGLFIFGYLMAIFDLERRTLFDRIAQTRVIVN